MEEQGTAQRNELHPTTQAPLSYPPPYYQPPQCYPPPLYNSSYCPDPYYAQWPQAETYPVEEKDTDVRNSNHHSTQTPLPQVPSQYCPPPPPQDCTYSHRPYYQHWHSGHKHPCFHHPPLSCHSFCYFPFQNPCIPYHPHYPCHSHYPNPTPCCPPSVHPSQTQPHHPHSFLYPSPQGPHPVWYPNSAAFVDKGGVEPKKAVEGKVDAHIGSTSIAVGEETLASTSAGHDYPSYGPHPTQLPALYSSPHEPPPSLLNLATFIQQHFDAAQDATKGQTDAKSVSSSAVQVAENVTFTSAVLESEAHLSNLQDPQEQTASYSGYKYSNTQNAYRHSYPPPLQLPHPQYYGPPSWGPHPPFLPGPSYAPLHCQLHGAWNRHSSQPPVPPPPPPPELYPDAKYPYTQYFKDLIQRFSSQTLNPHPSNETAVTNTVDDSEQGREETQPEEYQTWEKGNVLEGLINDDEEDEDGEEPQYAMTDEWVKFFAMSEARRREKRRQQKREAKAARKAARALELDPASCNLIDDIDNVVHVHKSSFLDEKDVEGEVEEAIFGTNISSIPAEPAQECMQASSQPHEDC